MHYAQQRSPGANAVGIGFVILLHIGVVYALLTGLGVMPRTAPHETPITFQQVPPKVPPIVEPQVQPLTPIEPKQIYIPLPEIVVTNPVQPRSVPTTSEPPVGPIVFHPNPVPAPTPEVYTVPIRIDGPALPYPSWARIGGLTGWVDVECDVDETGRTSMCAVVAHEGSNMFVEAALAYVKATRYSPATRNGVAVTEPHHRFHVVFDLK